MIFHLRLKKTMKSDQLTTRKPPNFNQSNMAYGHRPFPGIQFTLCTKYDIISDTHKHTSTQ